MLDLSGKTAVITGASAGIGAGTARLFAKRGAALVLVARRPAPLEALAEELRGQGGKVVTIPGDVTKPDCTEAVFKAAFDSFGSVDVLVNNAGIADGLYATVRTSDELWNNVVTVNETAPFRFCREALKYMTKQGTGSIVNISSIGGVYSIAGAAYSASKMALIGLTKNIAIQYVGTGIRCNAVCPGPTLTDMLQDEGAMDMEMLEITGRHSDFSGGICEPLDIANAILFFSCDESKYVNGQCLVVDKGSCL